MATIAIPTPECKTLIDDLYGDPTFPDLEKATRNERQAFRAAVATVAATAKEKLPESNGRVEKAMALVLAGDVVLGEAHTATVYSQADASTSYAVRPGFCSCKDFDQAPGQLCKHRLAAAMLRRALDTTAPATPQPLPEAPASVNCHVTIGGRDVQVTLRDTDESRLLQRLEAVLALYPVAQVTSAPPVQPSPAAQQPTPEGWCMLHGVQMPLQSNARGSWRSHKTSDGTWCKGR